MSGTTFLKPLLFIIASFGMTIAQSDTNTVVANPAPAAAKSKLQLFAPSQYDSILGMLPSGDSLRTNTNIVSIGTDPATGEIVVISLDAAGTPGKTTFLKANLKVRPVSSSGAMPSAAAKPSQNGRTWFIIESAVKSAGIYPAGLGNAFSDVNVSTLAGISLLTIGGTLYGTYAFTKNMDLGYGKTGLMNYGSTVFGSYYPALIAAFLSGTTDLDRPPMKTTQWGYSERSGPSATQQINAWTSMIGFPVGMVIGSRLKLVDKDDFGRVATMEYFSQTLGGIGFALPLFFLDPSKNSDSYLTISSLLSMALIPAGMSIGKTVHGDAYISAGRGTLPWVSGLLGTATGLAFPALFDYHNTDFLTISRIFTVSGIAGYGAGTWVGLRYHPAIEFSFWQTVFIGASSCTGVIMGIALPLIVQSSDRQPFIIAGAIGGWTGFFIGEKLSLALFEKSTRDRHSSSLQFQVPGIAMLPAILTSRKAVSFTRYGNQAPLLPVANMEWKF